MSQENKDLLLKTKKKPVVKLLAFIGICCFLQFFIVALIGSIHGHTTETVLSDVIFVVGLFFILPYYPRQKRPIICIYFISFMIGYTSLLSLCHGNHAEKGGIYYEQCQYKEALQFFKKETQTWYLRLRYNHHERNAIEMMAKTYCQLEDFDNARNTYKLIIDRYRGHYADQAEKDLLRLNNGLKIVANYPEQVPETKGVPVNLYNIARTYQYDLNCHTKAIEVYKKIIDMDIPDEWKELAIKHITELTRDVDE